MIKKTYFEFPIDGDCLNSYDGVMKDGVLTIKARVRADETSDIYINEIKAVKTGDIFEAEVSLKGYRNTLYAVDKNDSRNDAKIAVYMLRNPIGKYRLSSDDNLLFFADITKNKDKYKSIFENPYLAVYKEAHDKYGVKVHLNVFYETDDMPVFKVKQDYFNLSMMTDKYKNEWKQNSDWLKLSFHARMEHPDKPYQHTTIRRIEEDCELVHKEILRFAGEDTLAKVTTIHWGECNQAGMRTVRTAGYRGAMGYFEHTPEGEPLVAYYYPDEMINHIGGRDFWKDNDEDIMYGRIDLVLNTCNMQNLLPRLEAIKADPHRAGFIEVMIHEQYFYKEYGAYIPEFREIVLTACKWAYDYGYKGCLMNEIMFEEEKI